MALRQVVLSKRIAEKQASLAKLNEEREELARKREALVTREAELEAAVNEVTDETSEEDRAALDTALSEFEAQTKEADEAEAANAQAITDTQGEIDGLQRELEELKARLTADKPAHTEPTERKENKTMTQRLFNLSTEQTRDFFANDGVKGFLGEVRAAIREKRSLTNVGLTIPDIMLGMVREEVYRQSKLLRFVMLRHVGGTSRVNIMGRIPEGVWTEMCATINEVDLSFSQEEVDGYKVGAAVIVCNAILEDSDIALASEIISAISTAIAKAVDKAILFGTGTKMPVGIATRLAATSQPAWWGTNAPAFTDLHETNIVKLNAMTAVGVAFFQTLVVTLGIAKPKYSSDGLFWVMNRKTHLDILAKSMAYNANAALVANTNLMPIIGGTIVEVEDDELADYEIIGGFGGNYLMAERAGVQLASSTEYRFLQDQTAFKGTARYDGKPLAGEAFVIVNYANVDPTTAKTFPTDYANTAMNDLVIVAAAGTAAGDTVLTVSNTIAQSNAVLKYKLGEYSFETGDKATGFTSLTSGTTQITAAAGKKITVVELDAANRVVSAGVVVSVPKP